ncbi:DNA polymerase III subunit delta [Limosilactobacillus sp.]|uniref:DNA polymerase III subunit delta n=1 Tax=Limosilactobacillus sp. TaxID=2773925 RepID=UPI00345EC4B6
MDVATLQQQLKKSASAPVYLVLGTQQALQKQARAAFTKLIPDEEKVMNVGNYDMEVTPISTAINDAVSAPFFGEHRLVMINKPYFLTGQRPNVKVDHNVDELANYLKKPEPTTIMVLFAPYEKLDGRKGVVKLLKKNAVQVDAAPLKEAAARRAVESLFHDAGVKIEPTAMDELVRRCNADYGRMSASVQQLALLSYPDNVVTAKMVAGLIEQSLDNNVFHLVNAVLKRDQKTALNLYQQLLAAQTAPLAINGALVNQFRLLIQIKVLAKRGLSQGSIASKLRVHPYRVKLGMQTVRHFKMQDLTSGYLGLIDCDIQLKSSQRSPELLFQLFMLKLGHVA